LERDQSPIGGISRNVFLLSGVSLLTDLSSEMIYPLVPLFLRTVLNAPVPIIGLIEGIAESTAGLFKFLSGALSDRWGRRKPLVLGGYGLAALTKPLLALAYAWPLVLAARVLDRFSKGVRASPRDAILAGSTPPELRGRAFGFHRSADSIGAVLGPLTALLILAVLHENYRTAFLIAFIPGLLSTFLVLPVRDVVTERRIGSIVSFRVRGAHPALRRFLLVTVLFSIGNSSDMFLILRANQLGGSGATAVLLFAVCNTLNVISSYPAGIISDRLGRKRVLAAGFTLFAIVYSGFGLAGAVRPLWLLFAIYGVYLGLTEGISKAYIVDLVPTSERGAALGLQAMLISICTLPASALAGWFWQALGPPAPFYYGAIMAAVSVILLLVPAACSKPAGRP
jgi:MFS family permease